MNRSIAFTILLGCSPQPTEPPKPVDWQRELPALASLSPSPSGLSWARSIIHLHSPYSHDACDGNGFVDGVLNEPCLDDLRAALCDTRIDAAFITDHPAHAAEHSFEDLLLARDNDTVIEDSGRVIGNQIHCPNGHRVEWYPGVEDALMPIGFEGDVAATPEERDRLLNATDQEAMDAMHGANGLILQAHTEGVDLETLTDRVQRGMRGVEIFNLHAMFAPNIRKDDLGLDPLQWIEDIQPFTSNEGTAEPDLLFLGVLGHQQPSLERWDALNQTQSVIGLAGTDAHQNVLPIDLRDGERGDSYRRMLRWFSNWLLVDDASSTGAKDAIAAGRLWVVFEALGAPENLDFHLETTAGGRVEIGETGTGSTLHMACPSLYAGSPQSLDAPELNITILKDGEEWATGCGAFTVTEPGFYRVTIDMIPYHFQNFLGADPTPWMRPFPWALSNGIRVE